MRNTLILMVVISIWLAGTMRARAQFSEDPSAESAGQPTGLRAVISDKPFFGTRSVLTLSGDYINTPKEDFETYGVWSQPFKLEEMNGVIAKVDFGEARKQGEWQLSYRYRLMVTDTDWQRIADYSGGLTLSDRRSQVLKASYSVRDWWKLGVAAVVEDRPGTDASADPSAFGLGGRGTYGFQLDSTFRF
jgi:hypothetical protein